jgi:hypothetical protein
MTRKIGTDLGLPPERRLELAGFLDETALLAGTTTLRGDAITAILDAIRALAAGVRDGTPADAARGLDAGQVHTVREILNVARVRAARESHPAAGGMGQLLREWESAAGWKPPVRQRAPLRAAS